MMIRNVILALALSIAPPVLAQTSAQPPAVASDPDPARLAAATRLIEVVMPPPLRDKMIEQSTTAMLSCVSQMALNSPQLAPIFEKEPRARPIFERFLARQAEDARTTMRNAMPMMMVVMARAYARRLTVDQLDEARRFYASPTGQDFALVAASVMTDPDFTAMMQQVMQSSMARMPAQTKALADELQALKQSPTVN